MNLGGVLAVAVVLGAAAVLVKRAASNVPRTSDVPEGFHPELSARERAIVWHDLNHLTFDQIMGNAEVYEVQLSVPAQEALLTEAGKRLTPEQLRERAP